MLVTGRVLDSASARYLGLTWRKDPQTGAMELLVRYPVEIRRAPDIDEEMTRKVLELIETDAGLKAAVAGTPKIRSAVKG